MTDQAQEARDRIAALTVAISVRSVPRMIGPLLQTKLTIQQLKALMAITVDEASTVSSLAGGFEVTLATMSRIVDRIVEQGLVERVPDPTDQRVRRLRVTVLGREVVGEIIGPRPELGDDVLAGLDAEELSALETGLRAIDRELHRLGREAEARSSGGRQGAGGDRLAP